MHDNENDYLSRRSENCVCRVDEKQGPFTIAPGGQKEIPFRNVFAAAMDFTFTCDNPAFAVVNGDKQNVAAKSSKSVTVKFTPPQVRFRESPKRRQRV